MGILSKLITGKVAANVVNKAIARHEARQLSGGAAAARRANPRLLGTIGIGLALGALALLGRKRLGR